MITTSVEAAKHRPKSVLRRHRKIVSLFCVTAGMSGVALAVCLALALQDRELPLYAYVLFGILWTLFAGGVAFSARREIGRLVERRLAHARDTATQAVS